MIRQIWPNGLPPEAVLVLADAEELVLIVHEGRLLVAVQEVFLRRAHQLIRVLLRPPFIF